MSYCRFSSDNWKSDVYVYADVAGGYTILVANNRVVGEVPPEPDLLKVTPEIWLVAHHAAMAFLETCEREPIGLPHDGETFNEPTPADAAALLLNLRTIGYHVPQYAIDALMEEDMEIVKAGPRSAS